ncbi:MAG: PVC-type heme-binding CxxCH protein [Saonia sp.]
MKLPFCKIPVLFLSLIFLITGCSNSNTQLSVHQNSRIVLLGNNLCSRMQNFGYFETEMHLRYPQNELFIRNMCDGGNTPGFRPHSGKPSPWAFPGAEVYQTEMAKNSGSEGHFETPDEWLTRLQTDIIIAFFGYNESFEGRGGLDNYKMELNAFIKHTKAQKYNGKNPPKLAIVSPIAFEDLSEFHDLPNGKQENENLEIYAAAMKEIALENEVLFVDAFHPSKEWFTLEKQFTIDGAQLNSEGYQNLAKLLVNGIFGKKTNSNPEKKTVILKAVKDKNFFWHNDFKIPNGVHAFGRRFEPFGSDNYPEEIKKIREMTAIRDTAIWKAAKAEPYDLNLADSGTSTLTPIETNYTPSNSNGDTSYLYGEEAVATLEVPKGYKIELFASEKEFPDLANPAQLSFDNQGRLWIATLPSYPHYRPGDEKPNDKIIILEDTDTDGKADKQTVFADNLHLPIGFEFAPEGVYVSQGTHLKLYSDTDGDDVADSVEIVLSGFDDHDTHHAISAFCADPSGAIYMSEGIFLHSNVETPYGPVRATGGGFYRYAPKRKHLERLAQVAIPNPWGIAFDEWGQDFFAETSNPKVRWMMPSSLKSRYGMNNPMTEELIEEAHRVRPTSGLEFVSSSHFPEEVQGDLLICNSIGFLGMKQHRVEENGTGYTTKHRQDLLIGRDKNFRPVDMEFAPDGSLYVVDWHNILIGHMQHNARDPLRDHAHGRIYRITYPSRPLVAPAKIAGADIDTLLDNLKLPEYRTRYRTKRELRGRDADEVMGKLNAWVQGLNTKSPGYDHHILEALWVSWGLNKVDTTILQLALSSEDHRVRAAATRVARYSGHQIQNQQILLKSAADPHGRVRLEALVAASWMEKDKGNNIIATVEQHPLDTWMIPSLNFAKAQLSGEWTEEVEEKLIASHLKDKDLDMFLAGKKIYEREGYCITCHQENGSGLAASDFPPLIETNWVTGSEERLIKLSLNGLYGPLTVMGKDYSGQVPMMAFGKMLNDKEIAAVLTYVRNAFGNKASVIQPETVKSVRANTMDKKGFYTPEELLKIHPNE